MDKAFRIRKNKEIDQIIAKRKQKNNQSFVVYYQPNQQEHTRLCVSTSKKLGIAVIRNRIRRQIREMVRRNFDLKIKMDYVIIVRKNYLQNEFEDNLKSLLDLYKKINPNKE